MDNSPLATLPPELRNRVYELVLCSDKPVVITHHPGKGPRQRAAERHEHLLALTTTCKIIRSESTKMFYALNRFAIRKGTRSTARDVFNDFTRLIGLSNAESLRSVIFDVGTISYDGHYRDYHDRVGKNVQSARELAMENRRRLMSVAIKADIMFPTGAGVSSLSFHISLDDLAGSWKTARKRIKKSTVDSIGRYYLYSQVDWLRLKIGETVPRSS